MPDLILTYIVYEEAGFKRKNLLVLQFAARYCRVIKVVNSKYELGCKVAEGLQLYFSTEMSNHYNSLPTSFLLKPPQLIDDLPV